MAISYDMAKAEILRWASNSGADPERASQIIEAIRAGSEEAITRSLFVESLRHAFGRALPSEILGARNQVRLIARDAREIARLYTQTVRSDNPRCERCEHPLHTGRCVVESNCRCVSGIVDSDVD